MSRQWLDAFHKAGGPRWRTWYIYFGVVPPSDFLELLDMTPGDPAALLAEADSPFLAARPPSANRPSPAPARRLCRPTCPSRRSRSHTIQQTKSPSAPQAQP